MQDTQQTKPAEAGYNYIASPGGYSLPPVHRPSGPCRYRGTVQDRVAHGIPAYRDISASLHVILMILSNPGFSALK